MGTFLRRGLLAGLLAGLVAGGFGFVFAEPTIDQAIAVEEARTAQHQHDGAPAEAEPFGRNTQKGGLIVVSALAGTAIGLLFGLAHGLVSVRRRSPIGPWQQAIRLAGCGFVGVYLLPFLRYPANPPGVGDPNTVGRRTAAWLAAIALGCIAVGVAGWLHGLLRERGVPEPPRQLAAVGVVIVAFAVTFALPDNPDPVTMPADLLWRFRLLSVATQAVLWGGIGVVFGLLSERVQQPKRFDRAVNGS